MARAWLRDLLRRTHRTPGPAANEPEFSPVPAGREWTVRPLAANGSVPAVGDCIRVQATEKVRFGHLCLVASNDGRGATALGVVLNEEHRASKQRYVCELLITHSFDDEPFGLRHPLTSRTRARPAAGEDWQALESRFGSGDWDFLLQASRALSPEVEDAKTFEKSAADFVAQLLRLKGFNAQRELSIPGSADRGAIRPRPLRADIVAHRSESDRRRWLVIESEWTQSGGCQSVAQAYEYAHWLANLTVATDGAALLGVPVREIPEAMVHPLVVARRYPERCSTAERLAVPRMSFLKFVQRLGHGKFQDLPVLAPSL